MFSTNYNLGKIACFLVLINLQYIIFCCVLFSGRASLSAVGGQAAAFHVAVWTSLDGTIDKMEQLISCSRLLGLTLMKQRETHIDVCMTSIYRLDQYISELYPSLAELLIHEMLIDWQNNKNSEKYSSILLIFASANFKESLTRQGLYYHFENFINHLLFLLIESLSIIFEINSLTFSNNIMNLLIKIIYFVTYIQPFTEVYY